jgi:hypothetical protein
VTEPPSQRSSSPETTSPPSTPTPGSINRPPIQYKGADLDSERGPGLGCFRFQLVVLVVLVILTPISVVAGWPELVSAILLFIVIGLLLLTGQTMIFLMRLVAADRRSRRRPLASSSPTVGQLEDAARAGEPIASASDPEPVTSAPDLGPAPDPPAGSDGVRQ